MEYGGPNAFVDDLFIQRPFRCAGLGTAALTEVRAFAVGCGGAIRGFMGQMRNIVVVPYDPLWSERFRQEAALITAVFGQELVAIHHIGSTAIPGMSAKPVIDIMPVVRDIERVEMFNSDMMRIGYEAKGEYGIPGRRHFVKGGDADRTHHIHAYEPGNPEVAGHLNLRDYLTAHSEEAREYALLKAELAKQYRDDINGYMKGKDAFIKRILHKAQTWRRS